MTRNKRNQDDSSNFIFLYWDCSSTSCTAGAFKARLDEFWQHQKVQFDFTADMTGTGNLSEEVIK